MKKILIGMIMLLSLSLVGCTYSVKNEAVYNEGKEYFELKENKELSLDQKVSRTIEILTGDYKVDKFKAEDKQYKDYKYGVLNSITSRLNEIKEKGIEDDILPKHEATMIELDELREKQKDLYSEDYNNIINEYITIFEEINKAYKGENIDKAYIEKVNEPNKEYAIIKDKIGEQTANVLIETLKDQLPKTYKGTIKFK